MEFFPSSSTYMFMFDEPSAIFSPPELPLISLKFAGDVAFTKSSTVGSVAMREVLRFPSMVSSSRKQKVERCPSLLTPVTPNSSLISTIAKLWMEAYYRLRVVEFVERAEGFAERGVSPGPPFSAPVKQQVETLWVVSERCP